MHKEILTKEQVELLSLIRSFSNDFFLVGGTAIALYLGHRRSIDFDLFTNKEFNNLKIERKISKNFKIDKVLVSCFEEYTILVNQVKTTLFHYPFKIKYSPKLGAIKMPDLLTLAAMKAYALGRRSKWKDYVDLFFIIKKYLSFDQIVKKSKSIFGNEFNEKLFRVQLAYFKDIDYSEEIIYLKGNEVDDQTIKKQLIKISLS